MTDIHSGFAPPTDKVAVGDGQVQWPAVLAAAEKPGTELQLPAPSLADFQRKDKVIF